MPRHEQFLISALPEACAPSSRHSQQLGESVDAPSGLLTSVDMNDDDNIVVLHVEDDSMECPQEDVVEKSPQEEIDGSPVFRSFSRSERRRILLSNNSFNCTVMALPRALSVSNVLFWWIIYHVCVL